MKKPFRNVEVWVHMEKACPSPWMERITRRVLDYCNTGKLSKFGVIFSEAVVRNFMAPSVPVPFNEAFVCGVLALSGPVPTVVRDLMPPGL